MPRPLEGIHVLDLTSNIAGPCATMILAGLGAEVIKIERPGSGDDARHMAPVDDDGWSAYFIAINRGKRSVVVDLGTAEGVALVIRLAARCDVFIENFRGGKAEEMGLGEAAVRVARPGIVYASLSAFGPRGPDFANPGYDALVQARTGIQSVTGEPGTAGARAGVSVLDMGSGMWAALGIIAALFAGNGGRVDASLYQTGVMWMAYHLVARQMTGRDPEPQGTRIGAFAPYGDYATKDSRILIGISNDRLFGWLCQAIGNPALASDSRYATNPNRVRNREELDAILSSALGWSTTKEWAVRFEVMGVPYSPILRASEVLVDEQLAALGQMSAVPEMDLSSPLLPLEFSGAPAAAGSVPGLGEHTREVLIDAGFAPDEIESLAQRRIVEWPYPPKSSA